jgi:tRNA uridine 5-carboxymethylaminomethyl modification enzyme
MRFGYAVEYDAVPSTEIRASMETKRIENLFLAGQINGTSGYEEAGGQGIMAGINAALRVQGRPPFMLKREQAYIGVMVDDLTTKEIKEPYRLMTSRAEYRLLLRHDNADLRLTALGYELGLISRNRYMAVENKRDRIEYYLQKLEKMSLTPSAKRNALLNLSGLPQLSGEVRGLDYMRRPDVGQRAFPVLFPEEPPAPEVAEQVEIAAKYTVYIGKQEQAVERMRRLEDSSLPDELDYDAITGLRKEARARLAQFKPATLGQASRLSGVNPADIAVLMVHLEKNYRQKEPAAS